MVILRLVLVLAVFSVLAIGQNRGSYRCTPLKANETTQVWWMRVTLPDDKVAIRAIRGKVTDALGDALEDAFVEVFRGRTRAAGCRVGMSGRFSFTSIPSGRYELRISKKYFDTVSKNIRVLRKKGRNRILTIPVNVGQ